jgi:uncharacterized Zn-binding protein involved in type VI secretion
MCLPIYFRIGKILKRHFIRKGDKTTAGGVVTEGLASNALFGLGAAFHGAKIACPACRSTGVLSCIGPRRPHTLANGMQIGMDNDLCICKCRIPPRLIASQNSAYMSFDPAESGDPAGNRASSLIQQSTTAPLPLLPNFDIHFCVKCEQTGKALSNVPYRITLETGEHILGITDEGGCTVIVGADSPINARLETPYYGNHTHDTQPQSGHDACDC